MTNTLYSFLLTTIAGFSTMIGASIIIFKFKNKNNIILSSLAFASGIMICVSLIDLIPNSFSIINKTINIIPSVLIISIFIVIGIISSILIDKYLPDDNNNLYRVGIITLIAIILHNIPEGIATFLTTSNNISIGLSLTIAIALHNIPEGIGIAIPIFYATKSFKKALFYSLIASIAEPLGAIIAFFLLKNIITINMMAFIYSFIAGIMIHIAIYELLINSLKYKKIKKTITFFLIGVGGMYISHLLLV